MKRLFHVILAVSCLLLALTACQTAQTPDTVPEEPAVTEPEETPEPEADPEPEPDPALSQRDRDWIEDIEYLRTEYKARHCDPFYLCSEEEFDWRVDRLIAQVGELSDSDVYLEISAIIARMGDPHTFARPSESFYERLFPASAAYYDSKMYLTACLEGYEYLEPYLLREIVAVNGVDIAYINQKLNCMGNYFNTWYNQAIFGAPLYFSPAFFDWVGCDYKEGYTFQILNENQEVESVEIPAVAEDVYMEAMGAGVIRHENRDSLVYLKGGNWVEFYDGENGGYIYMSLSSLPVSSPSSMQTLAFGVNKQREAHPECEKLAVDLRRCPGGDASDIVGFENNIDMLRMEQVYVLTSGYTASAATSVMAFFKHELGAVFVGEPTGQFPSCFHMSSSATHPAILPNSQIEVQVSDDWYTPKDFREDWAPAVEEYYDEDGKLYEWESTILPDVYVHQDIDGIRQGKDSVLQWVLAQK